MEQKLECGCNKQHLVDVASGEVAGILGCPIGLWV